MTRWWTVRGRGGAGKAIPEGSTAVDAIEVASQWKLMWRRFQRHRLAVISGCALAVAYLLVVPFVEVIAPYDPNAQNADQAYEPPTPLHISGSGLFVYGVTEGRDPRNLAPVYSEDAARRYPVSLFVRGASYRLWNLFPWDRHLLGTSAPDGRMLLLGADKNGRDLFSQLIYGTRISLTIGLVGVAMSFVLGIFIGGLSGYFAGTVDLASQRVIEFLLAMPTIPLWMALNAALPSNWSPIKLYFAITIILSLIGWTSLARVIRSKFLAIRDEDFVTAARLDGVSELRIVLRHLLPSATSHVVASLTLAVPMMILSETSLSFLGLGLQYPAISWGVLLQQAQSLRAVASAPWLLTPGVAVVLSVLAFNFLGDGLRDAADPYSG